MTDHLFVYGTLRAESAHPMAHRLRVGARHVGKGTTPGLLYDFGAYPGAVFAPDEKYRVVGDVFALAAPRLLADLDKYEGVAVPGDDEPPEEHDHKYERVLVKVALEGGGSVDAWAYQVKNPPRARLIGSGDFIADRALRNPRPVRP